MSKISYSVELTKIIENFHLSVLFETENMAEIMVSQNDINRPGIQFAGYFEHFDPTRIQIVGYTEHSYIANKDAEQRASIVDNYLALKPVCIVFARNIDPAPEFFEYAKKYNVPIFQTSDITSDFMASLISFLNLNLAERTTMHGVLVEIYGEGVLLLGNSGVGKSETAIELVKRGHRLIADDAVEIKRVSSKTLVGTAPEVIRHFIELRGIGIVDVRHIFGMGSVKVTENINLVINLEPWVDGKHYDRLGMETQYTEILGLEVPSLVIPVKPGRNLAVILEVAAMNNRHKKMGFNAARDLSDRMAKAYNMPIEPI